MLWIWQDGDMEAPFRPAEKEQIEPETAQILADRDNTFDDDRKTAVDAREAVAEIRRKLYPQPH